MGAGKGKNRRVRAQQVIKTNVATGSPLDLFRELHSAEEFLARNSDKFTPVHEVHAKELRESLQNETIERVNAEGVVVEKLKINQLRKYEGWTPEKVAQITTAEQAENKMAKFHLAQRRAFEGGQILHGAEYEAMWREAQQLKNSLEDSAID